MTAPEHIDAGADGVAAVHIAGTAVWCTARTRRGGQHRVSRTPVEVDPLRYVDDDVMLIDGIEITTPEAVRNVIRQALSDNGLVERPSLLILTHPPHWGEIRRGVLYSAARPLAAEVAVVDSAVVATECAASVGRDTSSVVVVDGCSRRATATAVTGHARRGACRLIDGVASDPETIPSALRVAVQEVVDSSHPTLAVLHDGSDAVSREQVGLLSKLPVVEVGGSDLVSALLDTEPQTETPRAPTRLDTRPPVITRAPAWLEARTLPKTRGQRAREALASARVGLVTAGAVVLVASVAAAWWVGGRPDSVAPAASRLPHAAVTTTRITETADVLATTAAPPSAAPTPSALPTTGDVAPALLTLGRVTVAVPEGWHTEPGPERVNLLPDNGSGIRVLVVTRELGDGLGSNDVIATLQRQFAGTDNGGRFDELRTDVSVAGRPGLTYVESPTDGSTVAWSVVVSPRLQVSLGCQSTDERRDEMNTVCTSVLGSLAVADA
ncbi:hypothetical protein GCM10007304_30370 [Rhodococcoides trifolii]|uniref:Type VII secretion-associated protein n=1 Tax=Rhodococcoides trifolii TaxID=908250 RepID=A0A917FYJ9_9NOCA|nr:hypothetical protein GCM10007304_30370 [Rhodococcus trifolii]